MNKKIEKFIDGVLIKASFEHQEDEFKKMLLKSGTIADFKSEVELVDSPDDEEKFDVRITRTVVPAKQTVLINLQFKITPDGCSFE